MTGFESLDSFSIQQVKRWKFQWPLHTSSLIHFITKGDNFITKFEAIGYGCETWSLILRDEQRLKLKNKRPTRCRLLFYFTSYVLNMFRTLIYPTSGACDYSVELPHWSYCSWFDVCCRLKQCFSLQHGYHCNPTTPKLQHTSNQEQYDQCGNSTE